MDHLIKGAMDNILIRPPIRGLIDPHGTPREEDISRGALIITGVHPRVWGTCIKNPLEWVVVYQGNSEECREEATGEDIQQVSFHMSLNVTV